jgi:hypothetical protein
MEIKLGPQTTTDLQIHVCYKARNTAEAEGDSGPHAVVMCYLPKASIMVWGEK